MMQMLYDLELLGYDVSKLTVMSDYLEREKKQIIDAYIECYINHVGNGEAAVKKANSYYQKKYEGNH